MRESSFYSNALLSRKMRRANRPMRTGLMTPRQRARWRGKRHDSEDQQPFRCVECKEAVSHVNPTDCRCIRELRAAQAGGGL
jgi:hypothetical protein